MRRVHPNLGKKHSPGRIRRKRERLAELRAQGVKFRHPDPETHIEDRVCRLPSCGTVFQIKITKGFNPRVRAGHYCCQPHALEHTAILRRTVPRDYALLFDLYVVKGLSTVEIGLLFGAKHHGVLNALRDVGIPRRRAGLQRRSTCARENCKQPVLNLKHPTSGRVYGRLCETHYYQHRKAVEGACAERGRVRKGNVMVRVYDLVMAGLTTSDAIANRLDVPIQVVATTMGKLRRRGLVEAFGTTMIRNAKAMLWRAIEEEGRQAA